MNQEDYELIAKLLNYLSKYFNPEQEEYLANITAAQVEEVTTIVEETQAFVEIPLNPALAIIAFHMVTGDKLTIAFSKPIRYLGMARNAYRDFSNQTLPEDIQSKVHMLDPSQ